VIAMFALTFVSLSHSNSFAKYASLVLDAETGEIHHAINAETQNYPASLTKLMTLYLLFDAVGKHEVNLDTKLKVSARAARQPASRLGLNADETISVQNAIMALIVKSANDVASVVSENLAKSEREFALKMTAKAREIGMSDTTFRNASGLPNRSQLSTARDMATLARRIIEDFPHFYELFSTKSFTYNGVTHRTHNKLLGQYDGLDGLKTGYIRASGFNVVTSVERGKHRLIGVVLGGKSPNSRDRHMATLLNRTFDEIEGATVAEQGSAATNSAPPLPREKPDAAPAVAANKVVSESISSSNAKSIWGIQVGAFYSQQPAFEAAEKAMSRMPEILDKGEIAVMPLEKTRGRILYRARILGIEKRNAYGACRQFKRHNMPCMELRITEGAFELAKSSD
jgi:D-alanyl-D-alanine carboxypeptidase